MQHSNETVVHMSQSEQEFLEMPCACSTPASKLSFTGLALNGFVSKEVCVEGRLELCLFGWKNI